VVNGWCSSTTTGFHKRSKEHEVRRHRPPQEDYQRLRGGKEERGKKKVAARKRLECRDEAGIKSWFSELGKFEVVVEATASYEWFVKLEVEASRSIPEFDSMKRRS
jgi:hypothetical protein